MRYNLLIIPSFYCEKHCRYCMYRTMNNDKTVLDLGYAKKLIDDVLGSDLGNNIYSMSLGNGGDLMALPKSYASELLLFARQYVRNTRGRTLGVLTNINTDDDVKWINDNIRDEMLVVSYNTERPFNDRTLELVSRIDRTIRNNCSVSTVVTKNVIKCNIDDILGVFQKIDPKTVSFNRFETTVYNDRISCITPSQYFEFLANVYTRYSLHNYTYTIHNIDEILHPQSDYYYELDIMVTPYGYAVFNYCDDGRTRLEFAKSLDELKSLCNAVKKNVVKYQCLMCDLCAVCPEKLDTAAINIDTCDSVHNAYICIRNVYNGLWRDNQR